jgi:hypothetical protein
LEVLESFAPDYKSGFPKLSYANLVVERDSDISLAEELGYVAARV